MYIWQFFWKQKKGLVIITTHEALIRYTPINETSPLIATCYIGRIATIGYSQIEPGLARTA